MSQPNDPFAACTIGQATFYWRGRLRTAEAYRYADYAVILAPDTTKWVIITAAGNELTRHAFDGPLAAILTMLAVDQLIQRFGGLTRVADLDEGDFYLFWQNLQGICRANGGVNYAR